MYISQFPEMKIAASASGCGGYHRLSYLRPLVPKMNNQRAERYRPENTMRENFRRRDRSDEHKIDRKDAPHHVCDQGSKQSVATLAPRVGELVRRRQAWESVARVSPYSVVSGRPSRRSHRERARAIPSICRRYRAGTRKSVITVANSMPKLSEIAIGMTN